jgi:superfamily II DNA or RNA helicase
MSLKSGQIIRMRNRLWRIDEYRETDIIATPINGDFDDRRVFLKALETITPASMEVIDVEANGDFAAQQLLLRAYRFDLMHGSAPFLSLQRSAVIPYNYQLVPLILALEKPTARLLIADDVGLGKTIEAGLIMSELSQRGQAKRMLILTPANLTEQWQQALDYFFHIDSRIISSFTRKEYERELPVGANPWQYFQVVIASFDYAKAPNIKHLIQEQQWDLVLFDEAHLCSKPHSNQSKNTKQMLRYELMRDLGQKIENVLLLTATPHNGYSDTFASLLEILNPKIVSRKNDVVRFDKKAARFNVCQRNRVKLEAWYKAQNQSSPFPQRNQSEVFIKPQGALAELLKDVETYTNNLLLSTEGEPYSRSKTMAYWTTLHLQKRAISSPFALQISLSNRLESLLNKEIALLESDELGDAVTDLFSSAERLDDESVSSEIDKSAVTEQEQNPLELLLAKVKKFKPKDDDKLQTLITKTLPELTKQDKKIILFTKYKDTLKYLQTNLSKDYNIEIIHGGFSIKKRQEIFANFDRKKAGILIATDAISEGLNLQRLSSCIVHYELPWNPNRLEQRNGRIDRIGQEKNTVNIRTMILEDTLDKEILNLLVEKTKTIRIDRDYSAAYFGDEQTIKDLIKRASKKRRKKVKIAENQLDLFATAGTDLTEKAIQKSFKVGDDADRLKRIQSESFYDSLDIELPEIDKRIKETTEIVGSQKDVQTFVKSALGRFNSALKKRKDDFFDIILNDVRLELPKYGKEIKKVTFDPKKGLQYPDSIVLEVGNPIVRKLIEIVKGDFFNNNGDYGRTAYFISDEVEMITFIYHILARFTIGHENKRVIEELITFGVNSFEETLIMNEQVLQINPATTTEARTKDEVKEAVEDALSLSVWEEYRDEAVKERKRKLTRERMELFKKIIIDSASSEQPEWLDNMIHIEDAGTDLLAVTVVYPKL